MAEPKNSLDVGRIDAAADKRQAPLSSIRINITDFLFRMDRAAAMVEAAGALIDRGGNSYSPSIFLSMVVGELSDLKNIIDRADLAARREA